MDVLCVIEDVFVAGSGGRAPRLDGVSLEIVSGVNALMGPSGSGKTTLINVLAGFERPDRGRVEWSADVAGRGKRGVFWAPSEGGLWPGMTVSGHLREVAPRNPRISSGDVLDALGLGEKAAAKPAFLSKGERARLSIARALAAEPRLLLLDEPLLNIAPAARHALWNAVLEMAEVAGSAVFYASHYPESVVGSAGRVVVLEEGRVAYDGAVDDLYATPPDGAVGEALGPLNAFEESERAFLPGFDVERFPVLVRPEMVSIEPRAGGGFVVEGTVFRGSFAETALRRSGTEECKTLLHRPAATLPEGAEAALEFLATNGRNTPHPSA